MARSRQLTKEEAAVRAYGLWWKSGSSAALGKAREAAAAAGLHLDEVAQAYSDTPLRQREWLLKNPRSRQNNVKAKIARKVAAKTGAKVVAKGGARFIPGIGEVVMVIEGAPVAWEGAKRTGRAYKDTLKGGYSTAKDVTRATKEGRYSEAAGRLAEGAKESAVGTAKTQWEFTKGAGRTALAALVAKEAAEATYYEDKPKKKKKRKKRMARKNSKSLDAAMTQAVRQGPYSRAFFEQAEQQYGFERVYKAFDDQLVSYEGMGPEEFHPASAGVIKAASLDYFYPRLQQRYRRGEEGVPGAYLNYLDTIREIEHEWPKEAAARKLPLPPSPRGYDPRRSLRFSKKNPHPYVQWFDRLRVGSRVMAGKVLTQAGVPVVAVGTMGAVMHRTRDQLSVRFESYLDPFLNRRPSNFPVWMDDGLLPASGMRPNPKVSYQEAQMIAAATPHLAHGMGEQMQISAATSKEAFGHLKKKQYKEAAKRGFRGGMESMKSQLHTAGKTAGALLQTEAGQAAVESSVIRANPDFTLIKRPPGGRRRSAPVKAPMSFNEYASWRESPSLHIAGMMNEIPQMKRTPLNRLARSDHPMAWMANYELTYRKELHQLRHGPRAAANPKARRNGPTRDRPHYPFAEKEKQYSKYTTNYLREAMTEAVAAHRRAQKGGWGASTTAERADFEAEANWYLDDYHTLVKVNEQRKELRTFGTPEEKKEVLMLDYAVYSYGRGSWSPSYPRKAKKNGPTRDRPHYPWAEKEEQYGRYSLPQLYSARDDAMAASRAQQGWNEAGANWYLDDYHTIIKEIRSRKGKRAKKNPRATTHGLLTKNPSLLAGLNKATEKDFKKYLDFFASAPRHAQQRGLRELKGLVSNWQETGYDDTQGRWYRSTRSRYPEFRSKADFITFIARAEEMIRAKKNPFIGGVWFPESAVKRTPPPVKKRKMAKKNPKEDVSLGHVVSVPDPGHAWAFKSKKEWRPCSDPHGTAKERELWGIKAWDRHACVYCQQGVPLIPRPSRKNPRSLRRNPRKEDAGLYQDVLAHLRALQWLYWTTHWTSKGPNFYGDHLLLQRLYEGKDGGPNINEEIDALGERMVAYLGPEYVNPLAINDKVQSALRNATAASDPTGSTLNVDPLKVLSMLERRLQGSIKKAWKANSAHEASFSLGVDDFLMGLAKERDTAIYLLQQRLR